MVLRHYVSMIYFLREIFLVYSNLLTIFAKKILWLHKMLLHTPKFN